MPVYRLSSIKQTSHLLFSNQTYRIQSERRLSDRYLLFRCSSETEREPPTDTTNNNSLLFHLKAKSQSQSLQNINCWTQKTGNNNKPTAEVRKKILFSPVTFSKSMNSENVTRRRNTDASLESHIFGPHDRRYSTAGSNIHRLSMKLQNSQFIENHFGRFFFFPINLQPEIKTEKKKKLCFKKELCGDFSNQDVLNF